MVKFDNKKVGKLQRQKFKFLGSKCDLSEETPVERFSFSYTLGDTSKNHAARATVLQFPLRLCWALTAHKVGIRNTLENRKSFISHGGVADMRKCVDARTMTAEISWDCGNFQLAVLNFSHIYLKGLKYCANLTHLSHT